MRHKILTAVNYDCLLNRIQPKIYCKIKSHDLSSKRRCDENQAFRNWWTRDNQQNRIHYLRLSDIQSDNDRNFILINLVGEHHLKKYWLQCAANATNKFLIGFYNIIGNYRTSRNFMLDTIVEVALHELEACLSKTVN
jgi:hypothetical protein